MNSQRALVFLIRFEQDNVLTLERRESYVASTIRFANPRRNWFRCFWETCLMWRLTFASAPQLLEDGQAKTRGTYRSDLAILFGRWMNDVIPFVIGIHF